MLLLFFAACATDTTDTGADPHDTADTADSGDTADTGDSGAAVSVIPQPLVVTELGGRFSLDQAMTVWGEGDAAPVAEALAARLRAATGYAVLVEAPGTIRLALGGAEPAEGYTLEVNEAGAELTASDADGLYFGAQTLLQLAPPAVYASSPVSGVDWTLPTVQIEDSPRFAWRGLMLDVARHFFTVAEVERQIDWMAVHKLNRLHLHLSDDQGWRIEIKSWPDLAIVGGASEVGGGPGGYYTQDELRALIAYAAERHITVVPEVDFPGHANAALSAYPELNESGVPAEEYTGVGVISTPLWLDGPDTLQFVSDVWGELAALSPDTIVHIGGDEAVDINASDYAAFIQWLQADLTADGYTLIGWDEIGPASLDAPFYAQYWYDLDNTRDALARGAQILASPSGHAYLDMKQSKDAAYGQTWAGIVDTRTAWDWEPVPNGMVEADVIGVEGCLWTEYIDDTAKMDFMLWPRAAAIAERGWSQPGTWEDFRARLGHHGARLEALGVGYYADPDVSWE